MPCLFYSKATNCGASIRRRSIYHLLHTAIPIQTQHPRHDIASSSYSLRPAKPGHSTPSSRHILFIRGENTHHAGLSEANRRPFISAGVACVFCVGFKYRNFDDLWDVAAFGGFRVRAKEAGLCVFKQSHLRNIAIHLALDYRIPLPLFYGMHIRYQWIGDIF